MNDGELEVWNEGYKVHDILLSIGGSATQSETITYSVDNNDIVQYNDPEGGAVVTKVYGTGEKPAS